MTQLDIKMLDTPAENTWCPGCGNFGILTALKRAIIELASELNIDIEKFVVVTGIGCHGKIHGYINVNSFHVIHGRVLPVATGIKLANPELKVIGHAGDGDAYAIGVAHLIHAAKKNIPVTYIVHNNHRFSLTTGQVTPTTEKGEKTRTTPRGNPEEPINPLRLALASGATFVARGFAGDVQHLAWLIKEAVKHNGFSFIDVLQPCVVWDALHTYKFWRERIYKLEDTDYDPTDYFSAIRKVEEMGDKVPIGIFYKVNKPTFIDMYPQLKRMVPVRDVKPRDISDIINKEFR